jgi:hexosaminidase
VTQPGLLGAKSAQPPVAPRPRELAVTGGLAGPEALERVTVQPERGLPPEGYLLEVTEEGVRIRAADERGARHARTTLEQLRRAYGDAVPACRVKDWPDLAVRGVLLDISRDKVPTMASLRSLVDLLAWLKFNQLQLYTEHTFAYPGHEEVWAGASPLTPEEVAELDRYAAARGVELVPNQNCLGHMERWLRHDRYRGLAVAPEGSRGFGGRRRPPSTLDPSNPRSIELVAELLGHLVACCTAHRVHVGLDEPFDLPPERISDYGRYVSALRALPALEGKEMLVWGDVIAAHPELVGHLPEGVTVCEWGYEDWWPFEDRARTLADHGVPHWLCPGTSSWLSLLGRTTNAIGNCRAAASAAARTGATGLLVTDWGDMGHLQYPPVSLPGLVAAASMSWCLERNGDLDLPDVLSAQVFADPTGELATALVELGDAHRLVGPQLPNMSVLALPLYFPEARLGHHGTEGLASHDLEAVRTALARAGERIARARPRASDGALAAEELLAASALVDVLCEDAIARLDGDGTIGSVPEPLRRRLARDLEGLMERHRDLWLARNREGGLEDSLGYLEHLRRCYESGTVDRSVERW